MALRDLIPWSRQENRLPATVEPERETALEAHPLFSLHREVNRLFDDVFRGFGMRPFAGFDRVASWPRVELGESDKEIRITAELPGLDEKDVEIMVEDGVLTLRGEKRAEVEDKERGYSERSYGRFERRIALPRGIERDKAQATFRNGVLTVTLPRSAVANENVRRIPVNAKAA
ncbi:Hsp20/alpha crystallin family protein [Sphingomonas sp. dw_22]|uniref:Hsp20/alpha crystallin family protein n=1 Tax=Sphingomonas sp. dw_22 TaxID=2721175 RepID=UPI001BD3FACC|nr:Hsp20/alpha crystallin family protein [Sphingomonas sp. dw_22]